MVEGEVNAKFIISEETIYLDIYHDKGRTVLVLTDAMKVPAFIPKDEVSAGALADYLKDLIA